MARADGNGGREGIARARAEPPQVIFLDLVLPDMTGFEILETLKSDPTTRDIPVIVNSAKNIDDEEHRRLAATTAAILSKDDASREEMIARVREAIVSVGRPRGMPQEDLPHA